MNLKDCLEKTKNKIIPVSSSGRRFTILNPMTLEVAKITADRCKVLNGKKKCDYVFEVDCILLVIYVELKGVDLEKACKQLANTLELCEKRHRGYESLCYIICSRYPRFASKKQNIELSFLKKQKVKLRIKCDYLEHCVMPDNQSR
jgi:hypothetical protein